MSFSGPPFDNGRYCSSQPTEPLPATKAPDPLSGNWSYDNAIDLFSINTMLPDPFPMDLPDQVSFEPNYFSDPFAPPPEISGFAISRGSADDAVSRQSPSDHDSDDPLWSPTCPTLSPVQPAVDITTRRQTPEMQTSHLSGCGSKRDSTSTQSSSFDEHSTEEASTSNRRTSRRAKEPATSTPAAKPGKAARRAAHNVIEKRYRTNMNAKFVALEKATCGEVQKTTKSESGSLKKSEILANAVSHVYMLQEENKTLQKELSFYKQSCGARGWRQPRRTK